MSMTDQQLDHQQRSARLYQECYDDACVRSARGAGSGARPICRRLSPRDVAAIQAHAISRKPTHLYQVQMRETRTGCSRRVRTAGSAAAVTEANNPAHVPLGEFREIVTTDPRTGVQGASFHWPGEFCAADDDPRPSRQIILQAVRDGGQLRSQQRTIARNYRVRGCERVKQWRAGFSASLLPCAIERCPVATGRYGNLKQRSRPRVLVSYRRFSFSPPCARTGGIILEAEQ